MTSIEKIHLASQFYNSATAQPGSQSCVTVFSITTIYTSSRSSRSSRSSLSQNGRSSMLNFFFFAIDTILLYRWWLVHMPIPATEVFWAALLTAHGWTNIHNTWPYYNTGIFIPHLRLSSKSFKLQTQFSSFKPCLFVAGTLPLPLRSQRRPWPLVMARCRAFWPSYCQLLSLRP